MQNNQKDKMLFNEFPKISTQQWNDKLKVDLKTEDPKAKLAWKISEGLSADAIYRAEDLTDIDYLESIPGAAPFHRGTKTDNNWTVNRIIETGDVEEANKIALDAIKRGATSVEFNCSQVRKADSIAHLLKGIDLEKIAVRFDKPMSFKIILVHFLAYVEKHGIDKSKVQGSFNWDAMAYRLISGQYYQTLDDNINELKFLIEEVDQHFPNFKVLSINAQHFHNGGASAVQELAFTISAAVEYTSRLLDKGISMASILKHIHFRMAIGSAYFLEIAKFRALRFLWAKTISAFDSEMECQAQAYIHGINGAWNKSIYDPYVNLLRTTTETMSAAIAGVDIMSISAFDSLYRFENIISSRIAQNQQIVVKEEAHFDKVVDPAGGSYYIENLTDSLISNSWNLFNDVEDLGGYAKAMEADFIKNEIAISAEKLEMDAATRKLNILGTNQFPNQNEEMLNQMERPAKNTPAGLRLGRLAQVYESLRMDTEKYFEAKGKRPKVVLMSFGNLTMRKARAGFMSNFFACAGYEIIEQENCSSAVEGLKFAQNMEANIIALCSADDEYLDFANSLTEAIKKSKIKPIIVIAGNPVDAIEGLQSIGIVDFIHVKTNVLKSLQEFQNKLLLK